MIKLKFARHVFCITDDDLIMFDGNSYTVVTQILTQQGVASSPVMSKKIFSQLKACGFVYTNAQLDKDAERYRVKKNNPRIELWKFNVSLMKEWGY